MCEVIDFKTKKKKKTKVIDAEFDMDIVAKDLIKVINKHIKRKTHGFDIACALADVSVQFIHDTAPSTAHAQNIILTAMQQPLQQIEQRIECERGEYEDD